MNSKLSFYFRCQACNMELDKFQQTKGYCTQCSDIVFQCNEPWHFEKHTETIEDELYRMMNPPMGDIDEFFQDVENQYQGGYSE